jgi:hypothetical protein
MTESDARRVIEFILSSDATSQDCAGAQEAIHRYVDLGLAGRRVEVLMPGVALHLATCPECRDVYETVVELARLDAAGRPPSLPELWTDVWGRGAAQAIAQATHPGRVVPLPPRPAAGGADSPVRRQDGRPGLHRRPGGAPGVALWLPALVGVALCALALGWWQGRRAPQANDGLVVALRAATAMGFAQSANDGPWARVFYGPDAATAAILVGGLPAARPGQRIECWLRDAQGGAELAAVFRRDATGTDWWLLDARRPFRELAALALTLRDGGGQQPLVEVPLLARR